MCKSHLRRTDPARSTAKERSYLREMKYLSSDTSMIGSAEMGDLRHLPNVYVIIRSNARAIAAHHRLTDVEFLFAAGLEEISARLNLMVKAELAELVAGAPMNPGDPETRCQYLEKLLGERTQSRGRLSFPRNDGHLTSPPAVSHLVIPFLEIRYIQKEEAFFKRDRLSCFIPTMRMSIHSGIYA